MTLIDPRVVMHPEVCLYELCRGHTTAVAYIHTYTQGGAGKSGTCTRCIKCLLNRGFIRVYFTSLRELNVQFPSRLS